VLGEGQVEVDAELGAGGVLAAFVLRAGVVGVGGRDGGVAQQGGGLVLGAAAVDDDAGGVGAQVFQSCLLWCCLSWGSTLRPVFARPKADVLPIDGFDIDRSTPSARSPGRIATSRPTSTPVFRSRYLANSPTRPATEGPRSAPTYITRRASPCHTTSSSDRRQAP
jgi:hypothetical protein